MWLLRRVNDLVTTQRRRLTKTLAAHLHIDDEITTNYCKAGLRRIFLCTIKWRIWCVARVLITPKVKEISK